MQSFNKWQKYNDLQKQEMDRLKEKQRKADTLMTQEDDDDDLFDRDPSFDSNKAMQSSWKQN